MSYSFEPGKKRVLCVEGHADSRLLMVYLLSQSGYNCTAVSTTAKGLEMARREEFDLYILDSWYEDGTGIDLCRRIRQFDAGAPILFFSAWTPRSAQEEARFAGADAYLLKPAIEHLMLEVKTRLAKSDCCASYLVASSRRTTCSYPSGRELVD